MKKFLKGFTLIEMLVVIAIIGILAALLSGPLMRARKTARISNCTSNLRQIGVAVTLYGDSKGKLGETGTTSTATALGVLNVNGQVDDFRIYQCPVGAGASHKTVVVTTPTNDNRPLVGANTDASAMFGLAVGSSAIFSDSLETSNVVGADLDGMLNHNAGTTVGAPDPASVLFWDGHVEKAAVNNNKGDLPSSGNAKWAGTTTDGNVALGGANWN